MTEQEGQKNSKEGLVRGGRSSQSSQAVFEAGSWLDNRGSFFPQTQ